MINLSPPRFVSHLFPSLLWHYPKGENTIYITFDDGPTKGVTPWVLDILKMYDAKATFFCLAKKIEMHPEIFRRIKAEGHAVGNHTYSHLKGWENGTEEFVADVTLANDMIDSHLFRPPYGRITPKQVKILRNKYKIVMWSLLSMDYSKHVTPKRCSEIVTKGLKAGDIVVFHDSFKAEENMRHGLISLLEEAERRNYKFGIIE